MIFGNWTILQLFHSGHRAQQKSTGVAYTRDTGHKTRWNLEFFAQEADDVVGVDDSDHAPEGIDDGQRVEVVLVEHLGELVLVEVGGAGESARLGKDGEARVGLGHDEAGEGHGAAKDALLIEQ